MAGMPRIITPEAGSSQLVSSSPLKWYTHSVEDFSWQAQHQFHLTFCQVAFAPFELALLDQLLILQELLDLSFTLKLPQSSAKALFVASFSY